LPKNGLSPNVKNILNPINRSTPQMKHVYTKLCQSLERNLKDRVNYTIASRIEYDQKCKKFSKYPSNVFNADLFDDIFCSWNHHELLSSELNTPVPFRLPSLSFEQNIITTPCYALATFTAPTPQTQVPINFAKYWLILLHFHEWGKQQITASGFDPTMFNLASYVVLKSIQKYVITLQREITALTTNSTFVSTQYRQTLEIYNQAIVLYQHLIQAIQQHRSFTQCANNLLYKINQYLKPDTSHCLEDKNLKKTKHEIMSQLQLTIKNIIKGDEKSGKKNQDPFIRTRKLIIQALADIKEATRTTNRQTRLWHKEGESYHLLNTTLTIFEENAKNSDQSKFPSTPTTFEHAQDTQKREQSPNTQHQWSQDAISVSSDPETYSPKFTNEHCKRESSYSFTL
jgi:hypothetical protein